MQPGPPFRLPALPPASAARALCIGALWLLALAGSAAATGDDIDQILQGLAQHPHGEVQFSSETVSGLLTRPLLSTGVLRFDAPDRLEQRTLAPSAEDLIVEGDIVTVVRGRHHSSLRLSQYPQLSPLLEGIRATLSGDRPALARRFRISSEPEPAGWTLLLAPLADRPDPGFLRITIRGHADVVDSVMLERRGGDRTTITLLPEPAA